MRVKCKFNAVNDIPDTGVRERLSKSIHRDNPDDDLVVGNIYAVVALARWNDGGFWVYLHTVKESDFPYPYPLEMFDVADPAIPNNWHISFVSQPGGVEVEMMTFAEWIADSQFYEKLVDGDERAIALYNKQSRNT
jgi:hypothetical protein